MLPANIETEVRDILEKKGKGGWLRTGECAKEYGKLSTTKETPESRKTKFYRWRKKVEKGKVEGFKVVSLPGNIVFIGLASADPSVIESFISGDKKLDRSVKTGVGFFEWLKYRDKVKRYEKEMRLYRHSTRMCEMLEARARQIQDSDPEGAAHYRLMIETQKKKYPQPSWRILSLT